ncbi:MAG: hypothetical protein NW220_10525 [Leptolyngbyaceae cyanobacterium bins.349]|nr:hypothetical protein [Leptolyngbyaceae cyanobacterium bins.349]
MGKSTLLRQYRKIAEDVQLATALTSDAETSVPEALGRLADQFESAGRKLSQFGDRYKLYRQKKQELESDPDAPQGFSAFMGKSIAKAGLGLAKQVPGSGAVTPFIDEEAFTSQAGEWASYVAKKLGNKDDVQLVNEPVEVLTPLFLQDLGKIAEKSAPVLFFDTYERTSSFLDAWLRELLEGRHGNLPANLLLVIAGRDELDQNLWAEYEGAIARFPLNPFTNEEAIQYLHRKGITNDKIIEVILHLSGCLPLLVTTLAATSPNDPSQIGDPSETAVERFLQWIDDPQKRQVAIDAALPRLLNRDIIAVFQGEDTADDLFHWLKSMPFVEQRPDGWAYHDIARTQMLRYKRRFSPQSWSELHGKLATYYDTQRTNLQLDEKNQWADATWQTHSLNDLYHRLCASPRTQIYKALNNFLETLNKRNRSLAKALAMAIKRAGSDVEDEAVYQWGQKLAKGVAAYIDGSFEASIEMFSNLLDLSEITSENRSIALGFRGDNYRLTNLFEEALEDFNQATRLNPKNDWAIGSRGETFQAMERYEEALIDFNKAIEINSELVWAIVQRGKTYRLIERYDEALEDFDRAIKLDRRDKWAFAHKATTYRLMKDYEKAVENYNLALEIDPKYISAILNRGRTYRLMEHYESALRDFHTVIELDDKNIFAILQRASIYYLMKRYEDALEDCNRVLVLEPKYLNAIVGRGAISLLLHDYSQALKEFNRAIEIERTGRCLFGRALTYQVLNRSNDSQADFEQAIQLAQRDYNEKPENYENTFDLAVYHLAAGNIDQSKHFYRDALNRGASAALVREAIRDLDDFLRVFPDHQAAQSFKPGLEKRVSR